MSDYEISIIIPVFNEEGNLQELYKRLRYVLEEEMGVTYEILFVEDGYDSSWKIIKSMHEENDHIKGIRFSRRFGHQCALKAGLDYAQGKAVISMDADLQHPPELIVELYEKWKEGYQIVQTVRKDTIGGNLFKKITSILFYRFMNVISDVEIKPGSSDFRLIDRQVVNELMKMNERQFFLRGLVHWVGFKHYSIEYVAQERFSGSPKYTFPKLINFAIDGVMSFSTKPLRIATMTGFFVSILTFCYIIYALIVYFFLKKTIPGWTSILISVLFIGGIQLIALGIIGEYIGKLYIENKRRQNYIIHEIVE